MNIGKVTSVVISLLFFTALNAGASDLVSTILLNGHIITVDDQFSIQQAVALADKRIIATGTNEAIRDLAVATTRVIDLHGRTVIPGLIDNHLHWIRATEHWASEARLDGVQTRAQALQILRMKAASLPQDRWLFTLGGWYEDQFTGDQNGFTLEELDSLAPENPVFVQAKYDHAFVNTAWLEAMDIDVDAGRGHEAAANTLDGFVVRQASGKATGRIDGGFQMISLAISRFPSVSEPEQIEGINSAMAYCNSIGLTSVFDPGGLGVKQTSYDRIQRLADQGGLTLRIMYTLWGGMQIRTPDAARQFIDKLKNKHPLQGNDWYQQIAMGEVYYPAFHWDNSTQAVTPSEADIAAGREILMAAAAGGWPVQTHAIQPETIDILFDVMEEVDQKHPLRALRWSVTHADHIGAAQIERARALGVNLQLRSQRANGGVAKVFEKFGDAAFTMPPLRLVQDSGITYGFGSDGTKESQINPFVTMWWATTGKMLSGKIINREVLTRAEALIAFTRSNAFMTFQENRLGAIKPGLLADMVVLDRDYLAIPLDEIKKIKPIATLVGGRIVFGEL